VAAWTVDTDDLNAIGTHLTQLAASNDQTLSDYLAAVQQLTQQDWSGDASSSFAASHQAWHSAASPLMVTQLGQAGQFLQDASAAYASVSTKIQQIWTVS